MLAACALVPLSAPFWLPAMMSPETPAVGERPWEIFDGVYAVLNWLVGHFKWAEDALYWYLKLMSG